MPKTILSEWKTKCNGCKKWFRQPILCPECIDNIKKKEQGEKRILRKLVILRNQKPPAKMTTNK